MDREIKFRAWNETDGMRYIGIFLSNYQIGWKIMQYTGFKDKNGKEVFEGDIIHYLKKDTTSFDNDYERIFIIEWRAGGFWGKDSQIKIRDIADEYSKVIGNIYENPELIKAK